MVIGDVVYMAAGGATQPTLTSTMTYANAKASMALQLIGLPHLLDGAPVVNLTIFVVAGVETIVQRADLPSHGPPCSWKAASPHGG